MAVVVKGADAVVTTADCAGCRIGSLATLIKTRAKLLIQRRFHERLDELRGNQAHVVASVTEPERPVVGAATGFHGDGARRQQGDEPGQSGTGQLLAEDPLSMLVGCLDMEAALGQIDAHELDRLIFANPGHWSAPLLRLRMIGLIAHCARSGLVRGAGRTTADAQAAS